MLPCSSKILVIDDNEEMLQVMAMMLTRKNYKVFPETRVDNISKSIETTRPDLILLDKNLGWTDGCVLCCQIKNNNDLRHLPVLMLSAYHKTEIECIAAGADGFIRKPFVLDELLKSIEFFLARNQKQLAVS